jgi:uncharacterized protein involved in type VI secretion and phage assembly
MTSNNATVARVQAAVLAVSSGKEVNEDAWARWDMRFPSDRYHLHSA